MQRQALQTEAMGQPQMNMLKRHADRSTPSTVDPKFLEAVHKQQRHQNAENLESAASTAQRLEIPPLSFPHYSMNTMADMSTPRHVYGSPAEMRRVQRAV
jgi:hypothetical protein